MLEFQVEGMSCGHCVAAVTRAVTAMSPGAKVMVDLGAGSVRVSDADDAAAVAAAIEDAGYTVIGAPR